MTTAAANTIHLSGPLGHKEELVIASGQTILPGMLIKKTSANEATVHSTSGGFGLPLLVHEDEFQGSASQAPTSGVATAYTAANPVFAHYCQPGSGKYVLLKASENVAIGDLLISGGDGTFIKTTGSPTQTFAVAEEASNVGTAQLIKARFL
jgi:hypothetical protein